MAQDPILEGGFRETARAESSKPRHPWLWVPSLYFSQGIPYVIVMSMSVVMYKKMGLSNTSVAFFTSWLNLPWVIKPLWSPMVDLKRTKRSWIVTMQFLIAIGLALSAWAVTSRHFLVLTLALFLLMAFASATHDIAADGFYMLSLSQHDQAWWVGLRSTCYRGAMVVGSGLLVVLAGKLERQSGNIPLAWSITLFVVAALFISFSLWHGFILPRPTADGPATAGRNLSGEFFATFAEFFKKPGVFMALGFILLYRFDEAQLTKVAPLFLLDTRLHGGLGLTTTQEGWAYGTVGIIALTCGGLLGGFAAAKYGLKTMLPVMAGAMYLPKLVFVFLSWRQPESFSIVCGGVAVEQFGYGFGFTAFMLYMLYFADGPRKTAHYAICTGFMALGMMIPGLWSGKLADLLGYRHFFMWVVCSALPGLAMVFLLKVDSRFGRK